MKKIVVLIISCFLGLLPIHAKVDKNSAEYLKNKKHFAIMNPLAENIAEKAIKKAVKKNIGPGKYKVKFEAYTLSSLKKGIFKNLEITGKNVETEGIHIPYLNLKNTTHYNWIDLDSDPITVKSDMAFNYSLILDETSLNDALKHKSFDKKLQRINKLAYPLFTMQEVKTRIRHDRLYIIMEYNLPLASSKKNKTFMVSTGFKVDNGKIRAENVNIDKAYGSIPIDKITNLINLIDPLTYTLDVIKDKKCNGKIENIKFEDNNIQINGKIYIEGANDNSKTPLKTVTE